MRRSGPRLPVGVTVGLLSHVWSPTGIDVPRCIGTDRSGGAHLPSTSTQSQGVTPMDYDHYITYALEIVSTWDIPTEDFGQVVMDQARLMAGGCNQPYLNWASH